MTSTQSLLALILAALPLSATDITFAFAADTHVAFDGTNDKTGLSQMNTTFKVNGVEINFHDKLLWNETMTAAGLLSRSYAGCTMEGNIGKGMTLCNHIQFVRKLNALTNYRNSWPSSTFNQNGRTRTFASAGKVFTELKGVLFGGDLTDCAGGSVNECGTKDNPDRKYTGERRGQWWAFEALFDRSVNAGYRSKFESSGFLWGLLPISQDLPLKYAIYPGLGNHDLSHFDANDASQDLIDYVNSWRPDATGDRKITNRDTESGHYSYSLDWGNVHVIVAGVSPGAAGHEYTYNDKALQWFKDDLATYASDGRPVVISQHFGFDTSWSRTSAFWYGDDRKQGYEKLWGAIKNYNVIGFFTGHDHTTGDPYKFPDFGLSPQSPGYDVFRPGAAYNQRFAAVRVTGHSMDVGYASSSDYNQSGIVDLTTKFTKKLVPGPKPELVPNLLNSFRYRFESAPAASAVMISPSGNRYLLSIDSSNQYKVRRFNTTNVPEQPFQTGAISGPTPVLSAYRVEAESETRVLAATASGLAAYRINEPNSFPADTPLAMQKLWEVNNIRGQFATVFNSWNTFFYEGGQKRGTYLLAEDPVTPVAVPAYTLPPVSIYQMTKTGPVLIKSQVLGSTMLNAVYLSHTIRDASGKRFPGFIRYGKTLSPDGNTNVEFYRIDDTNASMNITLLGTETWPSGAKPIVLPMSDGSTQILIKTATSQSATYASSPYLVYALLEDGNGADLAWRGSVGLPDGLINVMPLGYTTDGKTRFAALATGGVMSWFSMAP